jgi:hypothetical protein
LYLKVPDREERDVQQVVVDRPAPELLYATRLSRAEARAFQKHLEKHRTNPARARGERCSSCWPESRNTTSSSDAS